MGDRGDGFGLDGDRADRELVLDGFDRALRAEGVGSEPDRAERTNMGDAGPQTDRIENLHDGTNADHLHRDKGALDAQPSDKTPDSIEARIARIRRTVGDGLRELGPRIARLGESFDQQDRKQDEWLGALRGAIDEITSHIRHDIGTLAARGTELRDATGGVRDKLETSERHREAAERELDETDATAAPDIRFDLIAISDVVSCSVPASVGSDLG